MAVAAVAAGTNFVNSILGEANKQISKANQKYAAALAESFTNSLNPVTAHGVNLSREEREQKPENDPLSAKNIVKLLARNIIPIGMNKIMLKAQGFGKEVDDADERVNQQNMQTMAKSKEFLQKLLKEATLQKVPGLQKLIAEGDQVLTMPMSDEFSMRFNALSDKIKTAVDQHKELERLKQVKAQADAQLKASIDAQGRRLNSIVDVWLSGRPGPIMPA